MLQRLKNGRIIAVHITHLNHQPLRLRGVKQMLPLSKRSAGGLVHMYMLSRIDTHLSVLSQIPHVALNKHGVGLFDYLLCRQTRKIAVAFVVTALLYPFIAFLGISDYFKQFGEFSYGLHFSGAMVMTNADLTDFYFFHFTFLQSNTVPIGKLGSSQSSLYICGAFSGFSTLETMGRT